MSRERAQVLRDAIMEVLIVQPYLTAREIARALRSSGWPQADRKLVNGCLYGGLGPFVNDGAEVPRWVPASQTASEARSVAFTKSVFRGCAGWSLRLLVDAGALDGYSVPVPIALAREVGLHPGVEKAFDSASGTLQLRWPQLGPNLDSVRRQADDLRAMVGDYLFVEFGVQALKFSVARASDLAALEGETRLAQEIGLGSEPQAPSAELVGRALGLTGAQPPSWSAIKRRLTARGEDELAGLIHLSSGDETEDELMDALLSTFGRKDDRSAQATHHP